MLKMKTTNSQFLIIIFMVITNYFSYAQTPYDNFAPGEAKKEMLKLPKVTFKAYNADTTSNIKYLELNKEKLALSYYDEKDSLLQQVILKSTDFKWLSVDRMSDGRTGLTPYNYCHNNPILLIDPDGNWDTKYEDENGNELLNTNDGSSAVVIITANKRAGFDAAVKGTTNKNDVDWNKSMKFYALGFSLSNDQESLLNQLNSDWSRKNCIESWKDPTYANAFLFSLSEALSQWTNPYLVIGGLSAGVAGYSAKVNVYRAFGDDAKANGYSWTPVNPNEVSNFRDAAGLPSAAESGSYNSGRFVVQGKVGLNNIIKTRSALPLDGNQGGLLEYILDPKNVSIKKISGVNPKF